MTGRSFKIGFIGGGLNSAVGNTHRIAVQMDNRWILESGCFSRNKEINYNTASKWGVDKSRLYDNWSDLIKKEKKELDAICILTPTPFHSEMVVEALNNGYAVICEKAMAASCQEAILICNAVERNSSFLAVTYNYTGYPMIRELKNMITKGMLGTLQQIQIEMPQEGYARLDKNGNPAKPQYWRLNDGVLPTISLDLAVHLQNMIYFLTEEKPIEVVADQSSYGLMDNVVDSVMCIARYTNNLRSQIWYSKAALGHRNGLRIRIYGDKGAAEWYQLQPEELIYNDAYGNRTIIDRASSVDLASEDRYNRFKSGHPAGFIEAFANHYSDIADCLYEFNNKGSFSSPWVFNVNHAKEGLDMMEAIDISSKKRCWQKV